MRERLSRFPVSVKSSTHDASLAGKEWVGFDEGMAAYERKDYATALGEWLSLAELYWSSQEMLSGVDNYLSQR